MFTIRRGKEYLSKQDNFVGLDQHQSIRWFPLFLPASQHLGKVDTRDKLEIVSAQQVINDLLTEISAIAPGLFSLLQSLPIKPEDLRQCLDEAAKWGGLIEHKVEMDALRQENRELRSRDAHLTMEAEKLSVVMKDYEAIVKRQL